MTWLRLSRNFGYQAALTAGLDAADADVVAMMDGDGQHPPAVLPEMVKLIEAGYDIVATSRIEAEGVGPLFLLLAMCEALYVVSLWLAGRGGEIAPGWSSLMFVLLIVGSALMVMLSIVGIYAGLTYQEVKRRPVYLVQEAELQPSAGAPSSKGAKHAGQ